jgi:hypothetical protein
MLLVTGLASTPLRARTRDSLAARAVWKGLFGGKSGVCDFPSFFFVMRSMGFVFYVQRPIMRLLARGRRYMQAGSFSLAL